MATLSVALRCAETVTVILDSIEVTDLVEQLDFLKWTGRPGYSTRTMMGVMLAKSVYALPTWTRTLELVREHRALRTAIGCEDDQDVPSIDAVYRFTKKLRLCEGQLQACTDAVLEALHSKKSGMGKNVAIDGSSMEAYAKGAKTRYPGGPEREFSDPDASWGHRSAISTRNSGQFYGYKIVGAGGKLTPLRRLRFDPPRVVAEASGVLVSLARLCCRGRERECVGRGAVGRVAQGAFRSWGLDQGVDAPHGFGAQHDSFGIAF